MFKSLVYLSLLTLTLPAFAEEEEGFITVEEVVVTDLRELPMQFLADAKQDFTDKNFGESSADLRAAAQVLRVEAKRSSDPTAKANFLDVATNLEKVAEKVKAQKIHSLSELNLSLFQAAYHNGNHHRLLALKEWNKKQYRRAGHDLIVAAFAIEHAATWSGTQIEKGTEEAIKGARYVAGKLIKGAGWTASEVGAAFTKFGTATDTLGKKVL
jgi:hypothetical protein